MNAELVTITIVLFALFVTVLAVRWNIIDMRRLFWAHSRIFSAERLLREAESLAVAYEDLDEYHRRRSSEGLILMIKSHRKQFEQPNR